MRKRLRDPVRPAFGLIDGKGRSEGLAPVVGLVAAVFADVAERGAGAAVLEGGFGDGRGGRRGGEVGLRERGADEVGGEGGCQAGAEVGRSAEVGRGAGVESVGGPGGEGGYVAHDVAEGLLKELPRFAEVVGEAGLGVRDVCCVVRRTE